MATLDGRATPENHKAPPTELAAGGADRPDYELAETNFITAKDPAQGVTL